MAQFLQIGQFFNSLHEVKKNYKKYDKWEQKQEDNTAKREYLSKTINVPKDTVKLTKDKAETIFRASDIMDRHSEDNCADMEQVQGYVATAISLPICFLSVLPGVLEKHGKPMSKKSQGFFNIANMLIILLTGIGISLWGTKTQKESSRIGRYQAKQNELKDVRNFVIYTPEQIAKAKENVKNIPDENKKVSDIKKSFQNIKKIEQDKAKYRKWASENIKKRENDEKEILNEQFTPKQINQGEADKNIILSVVKDVNMKAETYSENVENAFDSISMMAILTTIPITFITNKILKSFKNLAKDTKNLITGIVPMAVSLGVLFWATNEKKKGSRVGRFVERQEILKNPKMLVQYSKEQMDSAKNIKAPKKSKGIFNIGDNWSFFLKYLKEKSAYNKYMKTTKAENEKLYKALKDVPVTDKQLKEAKHLQDCNFRAFDTIDEVSQNYSEDTEAATEIAKQLISFISGMIAPVAMILSFVGIKKGVFPISGVLKTASKLALRKDSGLRELIFNSLKTIKEDKQLKKEFAKSIFDKDKLANFTQNEKIKGILANFYEYVMKKAGNKPVNNTLELLQDEFKQGKISTWLRNLAKDTIKLRKNLKANKAELPDGGELDTKKSQSFYEKYKTLCTTLAFGGFIPLIGVSVGLPLLIASTFTNLQLKAGRIGIMKAFEHLDNPKLFVNKDDNN